MKPLDIFMLGNITKKEKINKMKKMKDTHVIGNCVRRMEKCKRQEKIVKTAATVLSNFLRQPGSDLSSDS